MVLGVATWLALSVGGLLLVVPVVGFTRQNLPARPPVRCLLSFPPLLCSELTPSLSKNETSDTQFWFGLVFVWLSTELPPLLCSELTPSLSKNKTSDTQFWFSTIM